MEYESVLYFAYTGITPTTVAQTIGQIVLHSVYEFIPT
jgi:hypothetical protein